MRVNGDTLPEIAEAVSLSLQGVKRVVYTDEFREALEDGLRRRDSRKNTSANERMADIIGRALSAMERQIDKAVDDDDKVLQLIPRMVDLSKIVPPTKGKLSALSIAVLPSVESEDEFNSRTETESPTDEGVPVPRGPEKTPGGSKTHPPLPQTILEPEIPEWGDIEEEIKDAAEGW